MTIRPRWDPRRDLDPRELPAYTTHEAAHHLRVPENTVRAWSFGRRYPTQHGQTRASAAGLIQPADALRHLLSFVNLLELHVLRGLRRDHDVHMARIRKALAWLERHYPSPHPLLDQSLETDGVDLFLQKYGTLINVSQDGQLAMKAVFEAHLRRIERDAQGMPIRFFPFTRRIPSDGSLSVDQPRVIAIDPRIAFGRPVVDGFRIPTIEVVERFTAGDTMAEIATDYDCPVQAIEEALRWEQIAA